MRHESLPSVLRLIAPMTNDAPRLSLLDELDARQNELLDQLDELDRRIQQVLHECLTWRGEGDNAARAAA